MKKHLILIVFILNQLFVLAQSSKLTIKASQADNFCQEISHATLLIPITNAKDPEEKALIDAIKNYWTICPYKIISRKAFDELQVKHEPVSPKTFYLVKETYERLKRRKKDWAYTKYFISKHTLWVEEQDDSFLEFKLPLKTINHLPTEVPVAYLFGLMIKHFNNEIQLMKKPEAYATSFGRKKLLKVNFKHSLKSYANKNLLVSKNELENYMINLSDDDKDIERQQNKFIKSIAKKTKINRNNVKISTEADIKLAIAKADANSLIYTGYSIYNTQDATMLRRIDPNRGAKPFHWVLAVTIVATVVLAASLATGVL